MKNILCTNQKEFYILMLILEDKGYVWEYKNSMLGKSLWDNHGQRTVVQIYKHAITGRLEARLLGIDDVSGKDFYTIHSLFSDEYKEITKEPECIREEVKHEMNHYSCATLTQLINLLKILNVEGFRYSNGSGGQDNLLDCLRFYECRDNLVVTTYEKDKRVDFDNRSFVEQKLFREESSSKEIVPYYSIPLNRHVNGECIHRIYYCGTEQEYLYLMGKLGAKKLLDKYHPYVEEKRKIKPFYGGFPQTPIPVSSLIPNYDLSGITGISNHTLYSLADKRAKGAEEISLYLDYLTSSLRAETLDDLENVKTNLDNLIKYKKGNYYYGEIKSF